MNDVFLISFPKSGRTWIRFMLLKLYSLYRGEKEVKSKTIEADGLPTIILTHAKAAHHKTPTVDELLERYGDSKIVFLMRDPRDIMTALYHQPMFDWIDDKFFDVKTNKPYPIDTWVKSGIFERYLKWLYACEKLLDEISPDNYLIFYEDFLDNPEIEFDDLLYWFNIKVSDRIKKEAIEFANFANMKKMQDEGKTAIAKTWLIPKKYQLYLSEDLYINFITGAKVRRGIAGDYKNHLSEDSITYCNDMMRNSNCNFVRYYET